jgi:integral membrane protein
MSQTPATPQDTAARAVAVARGRLTRYRVMAWITGTMLLVLCLEMLLKYVFHAGGVDAAGHAEPVLGTWVAIAHGWIYVIYLVTVAQLWSAMRWSAGRLVTMAAAGVVPVMSFVLERRVHADALARIARVEGRSVEPTTLDR